jgi:hypothetical protein
VLIVILASLCSYSQTSPAVIKLIDKSSSQPIVGATVLSLDKSFSQTSDSIGNIIIPPSLVYSDDKVEITAIGHKKLVITFFNLSSTPQIELEREQLTLDEVIVTNSNPTLRVKNIAMGAESVTAKEAKKLPTIFGEADIIKVLQMKPGIKSAGEGLAGFYVRGGGPDQNLMLIDKAPVYNPNHLLGLFSVFNNDAVQEVKLYKAAYPAEYGGRLSSVLNVTMRSASLDSFSVSGGLGLLSSRLSIETPIKKGKSSIIVSGRRTYFDIFTNALNRINEGKPNYEEIPAYSFSDLNLRADWKLNDRNTIWITGYMGADRFASTDKDVSARFNWGNQTASLNWKAELKNSTELTSTVYYSNYQYQIRNQTGFNNLFLRSGINTIGMNTTIRSSRSHAFSWQGGVDGMLHKLNIGDFKSSSELSGFHSGEKIYGNEWGTFFNSEWDKGKRLAVMGGIRLSGFYADQKLNVNYEPRFSVRMNVGEHASVKASYTKMYQYLHLASLSSASLPTDIWYPSTKRSFPQFADQFSVGYFQALASNKLFFSVETYYKWMKHQVEFRDGANVFGNPKLENDFVYGDGTAYGVETYVEKKNGKTTGWIGYTLSWTTRTFPDINEGKPFKPRYDRRHDISLVFIHKFNKKFSLSGNWIFGSGAYITVPVGRYVFQDQAGRQPRTVTPVYTERGNYQLASVHRLDLSLVMALKSKRGSQDLSFTIYNVYSRRNPFYIQFKEANNKAGYVTAIEPTLVSLFPILPGITYNFKF